MDHYLLDGPFYTKHIAGEALGHLASKVEKLDDALSEAGEKRIEVVQEMETDSI